MSAYLIGDISIHDHEIYTEYVRRVPPLIKKHGGVYIVRGGNSEPLEGSWYPERLVVIKFPHMDAAKEFIDDPEYAPVKALRDEAATTHMLLVEGSA